MYAVEERIVRCGNFCWKWKDSNKNQAAEKDQGAIALVLDLAKAFEPVSHPVGMGMVDAFQLFPGRFGGASAGTSSTSGVFGSAAPDHHGHSSRVQVELLASSCCVPGRNERGHKFIRR